MSENPNWSEEDEGYGLDSSGAPKRGYKRGYNEGEWDSPTTTDVLWQRLDERLAARNRGNSHRAERVVDKRRFGL